MVIPRQRAATVALTWLCACAVGSEPADGPAASSVGSASNAASTQAQDDTSPGASSSGDGDAEGSSSDPPADSSGDGDGSSGAMGSDGGGSSSDGGEDTGTAPMCPNELVCARATVLGEVSGDEGSPALQVGGAEPTWVAFQVTEDNDSAIGEMVSFTATLDSPPGFDFDLYVYRGAVGGPTGCNGVLEQSTSAGATDVVNMGWGEGAVANGVDDRAWVAIEIRSKNDTCEPGSQWSLTIEGDG